MGLKINPKPSDLGGVGGGRRGGGGKKLNGEEEGNIGDGVGEEEQDEGKRSGEEAAVDANKEEVEEKRGAGRNGSLGLSMPML